MSIWAALSKAPASFSYFGIVSSIVMQQYEHSTTNGNMQMRFSSRFGNALCKSKTSAAMWKDRKKKREEIKGKRKRNKEEKKRGNKEKKWIEKENKWRQKKRDRKNE